VFNENSNVTEDDLKSYIQQGLVSEARQILEILKVKGTGTTLTVTDFMSF